MTSINMPNYILDPDKYRIAYNDAKLRYKRFPSAYASMYIQKRYQDLGGKYSRSKRSKNTTQWNKEEWIQVEPYLKGKIVKCGIGDNTKACRPLKRINKRTPITIDEVINKHGKAKVLMLAKAKQKDMNKRVDWVNATIK